jgi:hypothetical protein
VDAVHCPMSVNDIATTRATRRRNALGNVTKRLRRPLESISPSVVTRGLMHSASVRQYVATVISTETGGQFG